MRIEKPRITQEQLKLNPIALKKAKIVSNFGLSECNRVKEFLQEQRLHLKRGIDNWGNSGGGKSQSQGGESPDFLYLYLDRTGKKIIHHFLNSQ